MISIATLFASNGVTFSDGKNIRLDTPWGSIRLPKDGYSDPFRLQEAVEEKVPLVKGMIELPKLQGDMALGGLKSNWDFKELWDCREIQETSRVWGGSFMSYAVDHMGANGEFAVLDTWSREHYYNVCLSIGDMEPFMEKNPHFHVWGCDRDCLVGLHQHAVHGMYKGAVLRKYGLGVWECAPPLNLLSIWRSNEFICPKSTRPKEDVYAEDFERMSLGVEDGYAARANSMCSDDSDDFGSGTHWSGAPDFERFLKDSNSNWTQFSDFFRDPVKAKWVAPYPSSRSRLYLEDFKKSCVLFLKKIVPKMKGKGAAFNTLLETIWDLDESCNKRMACMLTRKLVECSGVFSYHEDGVEWVVMFGR